MTQHKSMTLLDVELSDSMVFNVTNLSTGNKGSMITANLRPHW